MTNTARNHTFDVISEAEVITLILDDRILEPSLYEDWRLAGKYLRLGNENNFITWVTWSRQAVGATIDVTGMVDMWHSMGEGQPLINDETRRLFDPAGTLRQKMDEVIIAEMLPPRDGYSSAYHDALELAKSGTHPMLRPPAPRESVQLKMKRLDEAAITPTFGTDGAACFDIYAICEFGDAEAYINSTEHPNVTVETGWAFEVPVGWVMKVYSRSGQGFKDNTRLANCVGIIDSDYRGALRVKLTRDDGETLFIRHGDRVAQAMLERVPVVEFVEVDTLSDTVRGDGAYGSTGR